MKSRELIKIIKKEGFSFNRQSGSHAIYKNASGKMLVIPIHSRDIPKGTLHAILKDAGLKA